jgi:hypothetical protein
MAARAFCFLAARSDRGWDCAPFFLWQRTAGSRSRKLSLACSRAAPRKKFNELTHFLPLRLELTVVGLVRFVLWQRTASSRSKKWGGLAHFVSSRLESCLMVVVELSLISSVAAHGRLEIEKNGWTRSSWVS